MKRQFLLVGSLAVLMLAPNAHMQTARAQTVDNVTAVTPVSGTQQVSNTGDPLVAYRAYEAAVNAGNFPEAAVQAHTAWQLAETKWGGANENTARLAFNAAWSALLIGKGPEHVDAARRAVELTALGTDAAATNEARFVLAYSEFLAKPVDKRGENYRPLARAAQLVEATWADVLIIDALMQAAYASVGDGRGRETMELANRTLGAIARLYPTDTTRKAVATTLRGQGRLFTRADFDEAKADFLEARVLYGPMRGPEDPQWGQLAAWETAATALSVSFGSNQISTGTRISRQSRRSIDMTDAQYLTIHGYPRRSCDGMKRKTRVGASIQYPPDAVRDGIVAGIVLRADIAPDGTTRNVRLLGAVPAGPFSAAALQGVRTWQYEVPAGTPEHCFVNRDIQMSFALY